MSGLTCVIPCARAADMGELCTCWQDWQWKEGAVRCHILKRPHLSHAVTCRADSWQRVTAVPDAGVACRGSDSLGHDLPPLGLSFGIRKMGRLCPGTHGGVLRASEGIRLCPRGEEAWMEALGVGGGRCWCESVTAL